MNDDRTVSTGNGKKVNEFRNDSCKRVKAAVWSNESDKGTYYSVQLQKGYKPAGSNDYKNMSVTFLNRLELQSAIACLQGALASLPEQVKQNEGSTNAYTSVTVG
jgi:hypothetical protein